MRWTRVRLVAMVLGCLASLGPGPSAWAQAEFQTEQWAQLYTGFQMHPIKLYPISAYYPSWRRCSAPERPDRASAGSEQPDDAASRQRRGSYDQAADPVLA